MSAPPTALSLSWRAVLRFLQTYNTACVFSIVCWAWPKGRPAGAQIRSGIISLYAATHPLLLWKDAVLCIKLETHPGDGIGLKPIMKEKTLRSRGFSGRMWPTTNTQTHTHTVCKHIIQRGCTIRSVPLSSCRVTECCRSSLFRDYQLLDKVRDVRSRFLSAQGGCCEGQRRGVRVNWWPDTTRSRGFCLQPSAQIFGIVWRLMKTADTRRRSLWFTEPDAAKQETFRDVQRGSKRFTAIMLAIGVKALKKTETKLLWNTQNTTINDLF